MTLRSQALFVCAVLAACSPGDENLPGDASNTQPFAEISPEAELRFTGTEPFWGGSVKGSQLLWSTPDNIEGETITVTRFAGRGGLSFSGQLAKGSFDMMITPGKCSDGMSDATYPLVVTVQLGDQTLSGCAWDQADGEPGEDGWSALGLDDDPQSWGLDALPGQ